MNGRDEMDKILQELGLPDDLPEVVLGYDHQLAPDAANRIKQRTLQLARQEGPGQETSRRDARRSWWRAPSSGRPK